MAKRIKSNSDYTDHPSVYQSRLISFTSLLLQGVSNEKQRRVNQPITEKYGIAAIRELCRTRHASRQAFPNSFFPQLLSVGLVSTAAHSLRTDGRLVPKGQTGNSPTLQPWACVRKEQPSPGGRAALEPGAFDWRRPQPSLRDSDACDWPPYPNTEVLGYCHASLRDIRIGCGALTFLSAAELREAFGVRGACSRFRASRASNSHYGPERDAG